MNLGTQYYRAPFPRDGYWEEDMKRMRDAGLNTVQLWVLWAWVEATPGEFRFEDYDRLVELAAANELGVVLSTIAEIQPYWIHRVVPDSEMVDHMGRRVVSSNRGECHFGLTPGGCTDHPGVWSRMSRFLTEVTRHFRGAPNLRGWDCWNELRWNVQADGLVCFCDHTLRAFRNWLRRRYGELDELNRVWLRRYGCWEEILPGKLPDRPYTEMMAFQDFLCWRACEHARARYSIMRPIDPDHPMTVHGGNPSPLYAGWHNDHALNRGNDWFFADALDGVGCSSFPTWQGMDDADFGMRVEFVKSAARDKKVWLSEVQGGRSAVGFNVYEPVDALSQQRWIWNGIACGADTILFWCWRDEVFGRESGGFGLCGDDGLADERLRAMAHTGGLLRRHQALVDAYRPATPEVGVLFSPQTYFLTWAQEHSAGRARDALVGYLRGLVRMSIPYTVVEENHLDALDGLKILFLPRALVVDDDTAEHLEHFVRTGGTLVCESECGAFSSQGFYRYPADRFTARLAGGCEVGRRSLTGDTIHLHWENDLNLPVQQWLTPWQTDTGEVLATHPDGAVITRVPVGEGQLILCGCYLGDAYVKTWSADFEAFLRTCVDSAGWEPTVEIRSPKPERNAFIYAKHGQADGHRLLFVFFPTSMDSATLWVPAGFFPDTEAIDLITGDSVPVAAGADGRQELTVSAGSWRFRVLTSD